MEFAWMSMVNANQRTIRSLLNTRGTGVHVVLLGAAVYCVLTLPDAVYEQLPSWLLALWVVGEDVAPVSRASAQAIVALAFVLRQWSFRPELGPPARLIWLALQGKAHLE
jgi:hypothetical protein